MMFKNTILRIVLLVSCVIVLANTQRPNSKKVHRRKYILDNVKKRLHNKLYRQENEQKKLDSCSSARIYQESLKYDKTASGILNKRRTEKVINELCEKEFELRTEAVKKTILERLHLERPPTRKKKHFKLPPRFIRYEIQSERTIQQMGYGKDDDPLAARTSRVYIIGDDLSVSCRRPFTSCYNFKLDNDTMSSHSIEYAELWVYKFWHIESNSHNKYVVQELRNTTRTERLQPRKVVGKIEGRMQEGWMKFNVTKAVERWIRKIDRTPKLSVRCKSCKLGRWRPMFSRKGDYLPILAVSLRSGHIRKKRRTYDCYSGMNHCCKAELEIDFEKINWDWIAFPRKIRANYCRGSCSDFASTYYNHTVLIQSLRFATSNTTLTRLLEPCCAPVRWSSVPIIYNEGERFLQTVIPNLRVEACGCT